MSCICTTHPPCFTRHLPPPTRHLRLCLRLRLQPPLLPCRLLETAAKAVDGERAAQAAAKGALRAQAENCELKEQLRVCNLALEQMAREKTAAEDRMRKAEGDRKDVKAKLVKLELDRRQYRSLEGGGACCRVQSRGS